MFVLMSSFYYSALKNWKYALLMISCASYVWFGLVCSRVSMRVQRV